MEATWPVLGAIRQFERLSHRQTRQDKHEGRTTWARYRRFWIAAANWDA